MRPDFSFFADMAFVGDSYLWFFGTSAFAAAVFLALAWWIEQAGRGDGDE